MTDEFDLCYARTSQQLHVVPSFRHVALCGFDPLIWHHTLTNAEKDTATRRVLPLCQGCVEANTRFDLRPRDEIRSTPQE